MAGQEAGSAEAGLAGVTRGDGTGGRGRGHVGKHQSRPGLGLAPPHSLAGEELRSPPSFTDEEQVVGGQMTCSRSDGW